MIADIDETLRRLILSELAKLPDTPVRHASQITFDPPIAAEAAQDGEARINLYLIDLRENLERRGEGLQVNRRLEEQRAGQRRTAVYIDLSYLVTAYAGNDPQAEHRLLADVLGVLLRCLAAPAEYLTGTFEGLGPNIVAIAAAQPDRLASADPASLWQALAAKMRPALSLVVTAPFDPFETKWTRLVREAVIAVRSGGEADGPEAPLNLGRLRVSVAGIVVDDSDEAPIAGVGVSVGGLDQRTITDERGFFYFVNLPAGSDRLRLEKGGYHAQEAQRPVGQAGQPNPLEPLVVRLKPMTDSELANSAGESAKTGQALSHQKTLAGVLRYASGQPAAFVPVRAGDRETRTDERGLYVFTDLPAGDIAVTADLPGLGPVPVEPSGGAAILGEQT